MIAGRTPNREAVKSILKIAWQELCEAKITWVKDNVFAITIQDEEMARKILDNGPWSVMKFCCSIHLWPENSDVEGVQFIMVPFWVQVQGVPLNLCHMENMAKIG